MNGKITVLVRRAGKEPEIEEIDNIKEAKQAIVGGVMEMPFNPELPEGVDLVCNEEGKFLDLEPNVYWGDSDVVFGDIFFTSHNEEGDAVSLSAKQIVQALKFIEENDASDFEGEAEDLVVAKYISFDNDEDFLKALFGGDKPKKDQEM